MYDRQELKIYEYTISNDDYIVKQTVPFSTFVKNKEIPFWYKIESYELVEAYKRGELKGRLRDIAAEMDADSNPVIMIVKQIIKPATIQL